MQVRLEYVLPLGSYSLVKIVETKLTKMAEVILLCIVF